MLRLGCAVLLAFSLTAPLRAEPIRAGAAKIDITPPIGAAMWGYAARRDAASIGVDDPLHARALVLEVGKQKLAIVSLDLGRAPTRGSMAILRKAVKQQTGIETLFLVASHTHHGPVLELDDWPKGARPYVRELEEKLAKVLADADAALKPARWGLVAVEVPFNRNRHTKGKDAPLDRECIVVKLEDDKGKTIAHLVNYAAHPTMTDAMTMKFSADYPGFLAAHVEKELGGACLFLQGAGADLSVNSQGKSGPKAFGEFFGGWVVDQCRKLECNTTDMKPFQVREHDFTFGKRFDIGNPLIRTAYSIIFFKGIVDFFEREYREGIRPHLTTVLLDGKIGLVGVSGEFFCSHSLHLKKRAGLEHLMFFGCCNDYQQYFPTIEAVAAGGYGADTTVSPVEIGAGERMMNQALINLLEMRGKIRKSELQK
jgi:neutral ceramidase